jgi:hypothetical protein
MSFSFETLDVRVTCIDCHNRAAHSFDTPEEAEQRGAGRSPRLAAFCPQRRIGAFEGELSFPGDCEGEDRFRIGELLSIAVPGGVERATRPDRPSYGCIGCDL